MSYNYKKVYKEILKAHEAKFKKPAPQKNFCAKTRKSFDPYEIWENDHGWTWKVLKKWQANDDAPYARWFCEVTSPHTHGGSDLGDCYVADIKKDARRVK